MAFALEDSVFERSKCDPSLKLPTFQQLNPYADTSDTTTRWQPVPGLLASKESLHFRRGAAQILKKVHEEILRDELDVRASTPEFTTHADEWAAHSEKNQYNLVMPFKTIARIPMSLIIMDELAAENKHENDTSDYLRVRRKPNRSFKRRYMELDGTLLSYYKKKPEKNGVPLSREDKKAYERGSIDLDRVLSIQPTDLKAEPFGISLVTTNRTWSIAAESEQDFTRWAKSLCSVVKFSAVHAIYKRLLGLREVSAKAVTDVRMVIAPDDTVGTVVENIFNSYKTSPDSPPLRTHNPSEYVLKVSGYRDFMIDRFRPMKDYMHVRECMLTKKTLRLTLVHESVIQERAMASLRIRTDLPHGSTNQRKLHDSDQRDSLEMTALVDEWEAASESLTDAVPSVRVHQPYAIKIHRVMNIPRYSCVQESLDKRPLISTNVIVRIELFNGGELLKLAQIETSQVQLKAQGGPNDLLYAKWEDPVWYEFNIDVSDIVRTTRIQLTLIGEKRGDESKEVNVCEEKILVTGVNAFEVDGVLTVGTKYVAMLNNPNDCSQGPIPHAVSLGDPLIHVEFPRYQFPIKFEWSRACGPEREKSTLAIHPVSKSGTDDNSKETPLTDSYTRDPSYSEKIDNNAEETNTLEKFAADDRDLLAQTSVTRSQKDDTVAELRRVILQNPLYRLSAYQKAKIWAHREEIMDIPSTLPRMLSCVNWADREEVEQALELLPKWSVPDHPAAFIELLSGEFSNETVRSFAMSKIALMQDTTFSYLLPQLVQALKFENHIMSPLAIHLLERATKNPNQIGFGFFWSMKVESYNPRCRELYGVILNTYLDICGHKMRSILKLQDKLFSAGGMLDRICDSVKAKKKDGADEMELIAHEGLASLNDILPSTFQLPIDPRIEVRRIIVEKCRVIDSAKYPLWLVFENAEEGGEEVTVIFKSGEDVRQNCLTLQLIRLMDEMWRNEGLDLAMEPYRCVSTSPMTGILEVVKNAVTTADIHKRVGILGAFKDPSFSDWIQANNHDRRSYRAAVDLFSRSCAGYCVATWVLGIGDRHNDNIMICSSGRFFHIDFDRFLGHFEYQMGVKRDPTPFVFTREMTHVLGGTDAREFAVFVDTCCQAYNIVRKHIHLLVSLLHLMVPANMPDLKGRDDINHLVTMLGPDLTDDQARASFTDAIYYCLDEKFKRFDNTIHILPHVLQGDVDTEPQTSDYVFDGFLGDVTLGNLSEIRDHHFLKSKRLNSKALIRGKLEFSTSISELWRGSYQSSDVAIKRLAEGEQTLANITAFSSQIKRFERICHANVVTFIGVEWGNGLETQVVFEWLQLGDLRTLLSSSQIDSSSWAAFKCKIAIDVVSGLQYLWDHTTVSPIFTLTSRKVLLDNSGRAKLNILSCSDLLRDRMFESVRWIAPEVFKGEHVAQSATVYSIGVLMWELDTTQLPYGDAVNPNGSPTENELIAQQVMNSSRSLPPFSDQCPDVIRSLGLQCLNYDREARPSLSSVDYALREILKNDL